MLWSVMVVSDHNISLITRKDPLLKVLAEGWLESKDNYFQTFQNAVFGRWSAVSKKLDTWF